jgi:outer membrane protein TolC
MRTLFIYCLFLSVPLFAQNPEVLSLKDCQKMALENHPYFKDKERIIENNALKNKNTGNQWLPQLNINGQATYQSDAMSLTMAVPDFKTQPVTFNQKTIETAKDQYKITFDVNQLIYDGGAVKGQKKITESSTKAELLQNETDLIKITEQVNQTYFALLLYKENINLLENVKTTLVERHKIIESGLKNGILQESDLDNIKIELLRNQQQIDELKMGFSSFAANLGELTGKILSDSILLEMPLVVIPDTITFQKPELKMLEAQQEVLSSSDKLSKSNRLPKVYAFSTAGYGRPGLNMLSTEFEPYYMIGIKMSWNIWDWNKTSRDRQSIAIQREMLGSKRQAIEKNLKIGTINSLSRVQQLESSLHTDSMIVELRKTVTSLSANKLEQGVITSTDYINDLNAETQARIQLETHKVQLAQEKENYLMLIGE